MKTNYSELINQLSTKYTQPQLAKICGCDQSTISKIKRGVIKKPNGDVAMMLFKLRDEHVASDELKTG